MKVPNCLVKNSKIFIYICAQSEFFDPENQSVFFYENGEGEEIMIEKHQIGTEYKVLDVKEIKTYMIKSSYNP